MLTSEKYLFRPKIPVWQDVRPEGRRNFYSMAKLLVFRLKPVKILSIFLLTNYYLENFLNALAVIK